ncbi:MAG: DUF5063 domain-containing protein [Dehalococcoidia bacterium]
MPRGVPIHADLLDHPDVKQLAEVAQKVCDVFERMNDLSKIEFLQQLEELLPLVYHLAHRIPDPYDWPDDDDDENEKQERVLEWPTAMSERDAIDLSMDVHDRVVAKLGWHSLVHFVYDPVSTEKRDAIPADLGLLLADVYVDLKKGCILYGRSPGEDRAQALWDWRFNLGLGWGRNVAEALLPIHSIIHQHYDEDEEVFNP